MIYKQIPAWILCVFGAVGNAQQSAIDIDAALPEMQAYKFHQLFFDEQDGMLDISTYLERGGFIPIPIIITEPAVDGGLGFAAQFISWPDGDRDSLTQRTFGGVQTGNGSYGYGYVQSGTAFDGRLRYKFGLGRGKLTIAAYPKGGSIPLEYTTDFDYGLFGSALWKLPDERFHTGLLWDFRKTETNLTLPGIPPEIRPDLGRTLQTAALGVGLHFDSRDNPLSPTRGMNLIADAKFNNAVFGSDRNFGVYDLEAYAFERLSPTWRLGLMGALNAVGDGAPFYMMPDILNRGIPANRYQGQAVLNTEIEITRLIDDRWSILGFAGYGRTDAGDSRFLSDSGSVYSGGVGLRYRIARKLGLDAGIDLAFGPDGTTVYFQFGHAWNRGMD